MTREQEACVSCREHLAEQKRRYFSMENQRDCSFRAAEQGLMGDDGRTPQAGKRGPEQSSEAFFSLKSRSAFRNMSVGMS